jgi:hypothetical protein
MRETDHKKRWSSSPDAWRGRIRWRRFYAVLLPLAAVLAASVAVLSRSAWAQGLAGLSGNPARFQFALWSAVAAVFLDLLGLQSMAICLWTSSAPNHRIRYAFSALLALSVSLFWTAVFFPALMSNDSLAQWEQALAGRYGTWHPPLMAMIMHLTQRVTHSPWLFALLQGWLFWGSIYAAVSFVTGSGRWFVTGCVLLSCNPALWTYTSVLWKDVWVAAFTLLGIPLLTKAASRCSRLQLVGASLSLAAAVCFRHNALTMAPVPFFIGHLYVWRCLPLWRVGLWSILILLVVASPAQLFKVLPQVRDEGNPLLQVVVQYVGITARLDRHGAEYAGERARFDRVFGEGKLDRCVSGYFSSPPTWDYIRYANPPIVPFDDLHRNREFIYRAVVRTSLKHPWLFVQHRGSNLSYLTQFRSHDVFYPYHDRIEESGRKVNCVSRSLLPGVRNLVFALLHELRNTLLFRHYVYLLWLIAAPVFLARSNTAILITTLLGISYFLGFVVVDASPDWRYLLTPYLCAWVSMLALTHPRRVSLPTPASAPVVSG